ncbi:MAG: OmpA family protein [Candidatus Woesebacteria bacterium]|nr:OmpA family protein [Candidatus Woesebacteria bacterium]
MSTAFGPNIMRMFFIAALAISAAMGVPDSASAEQYPVKRVPDTWESSVSEDSIHFDLGSSSIDAIASQIIQRHATKLRSSPDLQVTLIAHTDDLGSTSLELATGQARLEAVRKRLAESKIAAARIRTENHGSESHSLPPCADDVCRTNKRRVDFLFSV